MTPQSGGVLIRSVRLAILTAAALSIPGGTFTETRRPAHRNTLTQGCQSNHDANSNHTNYRALSASAVPGITALSAAPTGADTITLGYIFWKTKRRWAMVKPIILSDDFRIQKVLQAIDSDPSASISDLACGVNLSASRLGHLFKVKTGLCLNDVLATEKLEKAADLLRHTDMQVKEITYSLGYCQEPSFNRAFKKRYNRSPLSYRKQQRLFLADKCFG
jgi:AraC-like DNA-binding protein